MTITNSNEAAEKARQLASRQFIRISKEDHQHLLAAEKELIALKKSVYLAQANQSNDSLLEQLVEADPTSQSPQPPQSTIIPPQSYAEQAIQNFLKDKYPNGSHLATRGLILSGGVQASPAQSPNPDELIIVDNGQRLAPYQPNPNIDDILGVDYINQSTNIIEARAVAWQKEQERRKHYSVKDTQAVIKDRIAYGEIFELAVEHALSETSPSYRATFRHIEPSQIQTLMSALEMGISKKRAGPLAGIPHRRLVEYIQVGTNDQIEPFRTLVELIEIAEARNEARMVGYWTTEAQTDWHAAATFLAKRYQQEWGDRRVLELTFDQLKDLSPEQLADIAGEELPEEFMG